MPELHRYWSEEKGVNLGNCHCGDLVGLHSGARYLPLTNTVGDPAVRQLTTVRISGTLWRRNPPMYGVIYKIFEKNPVGPKYSYKVLTNTWRCL